jgi:methyl-accepting chemotaxis protein
MDNLIQEIESFKLKIKNANQLTEETAKLIKQLNEVIEQIHALKRTGEELEERYQQISKKNDEKYIELLNRIMTRHDQWDLDLQMQFKQVQNETGSLVNSFQLFSQNLEHRLTEISLYIKNDIENLRAYTNSQFEINKAMYDNIIEEYRATVKKQQTFTYITWALIFVGAVGVILAK